MWVLATIVEREKNNLGERNIHTSSAFTAGWGNLHAESYEYILQKLNVTSKRKVEGAGKK